MKKLNKSGFTLIELLAVITIMGILMMVAIPAVSRTIENSRRDTFASTAGEYLNAVRNAVLADEIECQFNGDWTVASATPDGTYYFPICTIDTATYCPEVAQNGTATGSGNALTSSQIKTSTTDLMESGGRSSFGNADVIGYVKWVKTTQGDVGGTAPVKSKIVYSVLLTDTGKHGLTAEQGQSGLKRSNVSTGLNNVGANKPTSTDSKPVYACKVS